MSFRSIDSRPPPSPNLHHHHHHHHHHPTPDHHYRHIHHQPPSHHELGNYRYSYSPYPSPPPLFASEPYLPHPIPPPPPPPPPQSQPPKSNPNYYQFSLPNTPDHHPRRSVVSNSQYFPAATPNRGGTSSSSSFSRLEFDQDLRCYPDRVERGPTFVSAVRPEEELLRVGTACFSGYDSSCNSRLYGSEINRRLCEFDGLADRPDFRLGSLNYGEKEFAGRFSKERCDDSYSRSIGGLDKSFYVIPTMQVQKRSAFSRLQIPEIRHSPRKFDRERCSGSIYDDKNGSSQFRCKGALPCPEIVVKDRRNEKSVDLDVSFKSNSLVAKAVVASRSSALLLADDSSPKAKRLRSLGQFDKESDYLPLRNKFEENLQRPNGSQSMATVPSGSRLVLNKDSPSKINRPKSIMASIKNSGKLSLKKEIEQGMERSNEFSNTVASNGLVKEETRVEKGIVSAGFGGMSSCSNENAVKSGPENSTDEARKSVKILNADKAHPIVQLKDGALSIGKNVIRDEVSIHKSDKKDSLLNKEDVLVIKSEAGNGKGEGGKFKMVLKANKARRLVKKDNVLVKKNEARNGNADGGKVEMVLSADKTDHSLQSLVKAVPVRKGSHVGLTRNVPALVDRVVTSESGERDGCWNKTDFSESDRRVISRKGEAGEPKNLSKAEKSIYTGGVRSNLVVGWRIGTPKSGEKPGCLNQCDVSASNIQAGKGKSESGWIEKGFKDDNTGPDWLSTTEAVSMRKVIDGGPKENVRSCKDDKLIVWDEGTSSGRKDVAGSDKGKIICGDKNSIPSGRKVVQKKKIVKKVVKKVKRHLEIHHLNPFQKDDKSWKPDHTAMDGLAAMIGHDSSAAEGPLEVENACGDISASPNASNIILNDLFPLTQTLAKGISPAIKGDVNGEDDNRMNDSQKQRRGSLPISQAGPSCIKETFNSASKTFENPQDGLISNSSQNIFDFTIVSNLKTSTESCIPLPTNGGPCKEPIISKDESMCISLSDPASLVFHRMSTSPSPDPDTSLINAQEPNLPCGPDKESIAYPSMPSTLLASPEDTRDALKGSSDPSRMKSSSDLKENSKVPAKYGIFEHERHSSSKSLPIELNGGWSTGNSSVLIPDKKSGKYSVISQGTGNITFPDEGSFSTHLAQPDVTMLDPCDSHAKVVDNSQELTSEDSVCPMLTADYVGGLDIGLTSSKHLNNIQKIETMGDFANGVIPVDTVMDVHESRVSPGTKKRKLSCSEEHSRGTSSHEHMSSLPNDDRTFSSGRKLATGEDTKLSGIEGGPLSRVALNVIELSSGKRGNTSLFDDAVLPGTDKSINNRFQTQKILNYGLFSGCSPMQNELSDLYRMEDTKERCLASNATNSHNMEIVEKIGGSKIMDAQTSEKQDIGWCEMTQSNFPGEVHFHMVEKNIPGSLLGNQPRDSPFPSNIPCAVGIEKLSDSGSSNEMMDPKSRPISDRSSPEETDICSGSKVSIFRSPLHQFPQKMMGKDSNERADQPAVPGESMNDDDHPVVPDSPFYSNSAEEIHRDCSILEKPLDLPKEDFRSTEFCYKGSGLPVGPKPCIPEQRALPVHSSFISRTSKINNSTMNSRTWHRASNVSAYVPGMQLSPNVVLPMKRSFTGGNGKILDSSYVRKGNSLVRKPTAPASQFTSSSVHKSGSSVMVEPEKKSGCGKTANSSDQANFFISEGMVSSSERPLSPSVACAGASPNHIFVSSEKYCTSSSAGPLMNISDVPTADSVDSGQGSHLGFSCEDTVGSQLRQDQVYSAVQKNMNNGSSNKILYVKPKSNKLIATKDLSDQANITEKNKALTSSGYFKRKRNQLIRSSVGNSIAHEISMPLVDAMSEDHGTSEGLSSWKRHQMVIPQLFPWKRASYCRKLMKTSMGPGGRSCPASSQRLKLLRKRDAVYIRSKHGLSLRRSKVLSIGGSSLKWSKSIERRSKKVNEDATRALLEAQRKKREQKASISARTKKENNGSRGRIFRIGSQRYKMDPSRRTLQRIPDDESIKSATSDTKKLLTKLFVPRRLLIGNDEYVRIGSGNQLIRDPKKRSRLIASEKVRWSLHTARQRLAKKKKYCQFFTRFGKCNKDGGKCPYIHDPSKVAVCTKFLNGLCSNKDCKLTHKIIPERMPDCSFFLQGLCANKNCPYRHVNVNPKAPTCEAFLRGYCMDGNECRKKHSYVCPVFGATGNCPHGSKCKLHHPKARNRAKKRKRSREKKNCRDRYFGSMSRRVLQPGASVSEKPSSDTPGETLDLPDYIALGSSDDEAGEGGGLSDLRCGDLDGLINPLAYGN